VESWLAKSTLLGTVAGYVAGLLGIGGGILKVPGFVLLLKYDHYRAAATSVATIVLSAAAALYTFSGDGSVQWSSAGVIFIGAAVGAWLGARYMDRVPEHLLAGTFSVVMAISAIRMWF
jgi:uncharacterized membrane protein YfcA